MLNFIVRIIKKMGRILKADKLYYWMQYICANEKLKMSVEEAEGILNEYAPRPDSSAITNNKILEKKYDLTIIIPAYNSEKWIKECLESVLRQKTTYKYKVVVINDGSTDHTLEIINSYKNLYSNLYIINQQNKGYSGARNTALKEIESKYIMFVDSDDILLEGAISSLMDTAVNNNADIVEGSAHAFNEKRNLYDIKKENCFNTRENLWGAPWLKVIRSELMERLEFPENYLYEDTMIGYLLYPQADVISTIANYVYGYRIHESSITQKHLKKSNRVDSFWIMVLMHENMRELNIRIDYDRYKLTMGHIVRTYRRCILLEDKVNQAIFTLTKQFLIENYSKFFDENDKYKRLLEAINNNNYRRYCVICRNFEF